MPIKHRQEHPSPEIEYSVISIPDESDLGTGRFTTLLKSNVLSRSRFISSIAANVPLFQISVNINPDTGEAVVLLGRADGTDPVSGKVFLLPTSVEPTVGHEFVAEFEKWQVTDLQLDGQTLPEKPIAEGLLSKQDVLVEIAPQIRGHATPRDLIRPAGTLHMVSNYSELDSNKAGFLFRLMSNTYYLEVGFTETHFYIARNNQRLETPIVSENRPSGHVHFFAMWEPTQLSLTILDESYREAVSELSDEERTKEAEQRRRILRTPPTIPPNSLLAWARREAILPTMTYDSVEHFNEVVASSLRSIADEVESFGLRNPFWDIAYDGSMIAARRPKREPDIHPTIHALLFYIAEAKNLQIIPEYRVAGGQLDFLISGPLSTGETADVCVEFKHAHSDDLHDGLLKQLPAYMQAKGCDFGIYFVMYFKGQHFSEPSEYDSQELRVLLEKLRLAQGLTNIRILILDCSYRKPPSEL